MSTNIAESITIMPRLEMISLLVLVNRHMIAQLALEVANYMPCIIVVVKCRRCLQLFTAQITCERSFWYHVWKVNSLDVSQKRLLVPVDLVAVIARVNYSIVTALGVEFHVFTLEYFMADFALFVLGFFLKFLLYLHWFWTSEFFTMTFHDFFRQFPVYNHVLVEVRFARQLFAAIITLKASFSL